MVYAKGSTRTALPGSPRITKGSPSRNFLRRRLQVHPTQYHAICPRPTSPAREHCELESTKSFNLTGLSVGIPMSSRAKLTFFCKTRESCKQCNYKCKESKSSKRRVKESVSSTLWKCGCLGDLGKTFHWDSGDFSLTLMMRSPGSCPGSSRASHTAKARPRRMRPGIGTWLHPPKCKGHQYKACCACFTNLRESPLFQARPESRMVSFPAASQVP